VLDELLTQIKGVVITGDNIPSPNTNLYLKITPKYSP
jgi:hypothetical protein